MKVRRVVIDTNVLISAALIGHSPPALAVHLVLQHGRVVFSEDTFAELETRLWRAKFDRYLTLEARKSLLHDWRAVSDWVAPAMTTRHSRDATDDMFVHAALAGGAELLISGERDLLDLGATAGVTAGVTKVTPAQALTLIQAWPR